MAIIAAFLVGLWWFAVVVAGLELGLAVLLRLSK